MKTKITVNCVASSYAADDERIIEFFDKPTQQGGLIAFTRHGDELLVDLYRLDGKVTVRHRQTGSTPRVKGGN